MIKGSAWWSNVESDSSSSHISGASRRPPKGDPERGIRKKKNMVEWLESAFWLKCDFYDQWNRNPRPQLEPQTTSLDKCKINSSISETPVYWISGAGVGGSYSIGDSRWCVGRIPLLGSPIGGWWATELGATWWGQRYARKNSTQWSTNPKP